jgi:hypothetical protein
VLACVRHGADLSQVKHAQVYPVGGLNSPNAEAALEVARRATCMRPFFWMAATEPPARETRPR